MWVQFHLCWSSSGLASETNLIKLLTKKALLNKLVKIAGEESSVQNMIYSDGYLFWSFQQGRNPQDWFTYAFIDGFS